MNKELAAFLAQHTPFAEGEAIWGGGQIHLHVTCYLSSAIPPLAYVTSVRSIVLNGDRVLVMRNPDDTHIMPGGRREPGETLAETLHREILEEAGWGIEIGALVGFLHFHQLSPKPPDYPYPYPDFLQLVYVSHTTQEQPTARSADDFELEAQFRPIAEVSADPALDVNQLLYLRAALGE